MESTNELRKTIQIAAGLTSEHTLGEQVEAQVKANKFPSEEILKHCLALFTTTQDEYAKFVITRIASYADPEGAFPLMLKLLKAQKKSYRKSACYYLSLVNFDRSITPLLETLQDDPNPNVRYNAIRALRDSGDERAIKPLQQAILHDDGIAEDWDQDGVWDVPLKEAAEKAIDRIKQRLNQ